MNKRRTLASALILLSAWVAGVSCSRTSEKSTGTNWVLCESNADCREYPGASCGADGFCVDGSGERVSWGADPSPEAGAAPDGLFEKLRTAGIDKIDLLFMID
ncbi:MAG: hypothetical protein FJ104_14800, partial [Deltaproteobacteria bacterium]|nr:hypothetical protein [Deltaproteobacteria bacterium]